MSLLTLAALLTFAVYTPPPDIQAHHRARGERIHAVHYDAKVGVCR